MAVLKTRLCIVLTTLMLMGCQAARSSMRAVPLDARELEAAQKIKPDAPPLEHVNASVLEQTTYTKTYDPSYTKLDYPNGDVPKETGVCADVIVRAFRAGGIDLQKELHEDMAGSFNKYPQRWNARRPDKNIDHRRVPNLMTWFDRQGKSQPTTQDAKDYLPGDVVAWELSGGLLHIGMVSKIKVEQTERYAVVHNIGAGARLEDVLFAWKIIGHYRYF